MTKIVPVLLALMLFPVFCLAEGEDTPSKISGTELINAEKLIDLFEEEDDLVLIDARAEADRKGGHIEGSVWLADYNTTPPSLGSHIDSKETPVCFFCNGVKCGRSVKSIAIAIEAGYSNIYWFRGGMEEWEKKGYPVIN